MGLLLCYNGGVQLDTDLAHTRSSSQTAMLAVAWNSKKLPYIYESWLQTVCMEFPVPGNQTRVISNVDVSSNELTNLPVALFQLKHLIRLDVSRNKITDLPVFPDDPHNAWDCPRLSELDISSNKLTSLPSLLFTLPELKEINANSNTISEVDINVWTAPRLCKLFLSRNNLQTFPTSESALTASTESPLIPTTSAEPGRESGYQSGFPTSPIPRAPPESHSSPQLPSSRGAKLITESQSTFEESISVWGRRRKSIPLAGIVPNKGPLRAKVVRDRRKSVGSSFLGWRFKNYQDTNFELDDLDDLESEASDEGSETSPLEHLDLSHIQLTSVPRGLSCLAPKLQKLNVSHNCIRSLGHLNDYPPYLELIDASHNELSAAITEPVIHTYASCGRRKLANVSSSALVESIASPLAPYKPCSHRLHKSLQKLSTVRLTHNQLVDVQLFRMVSRTRSGDLTSSIDETATPPKLRTNTTADPTATRVSPGPAVHKEHLSKSISAPAYEVRPATTKRSTVHRAGSNDSAHTAHRGHSSNSSNSVDSQEDSSVQSPTSAIFSPLYPMLSTLEVANNKLHSVPHNIHLVSTLACLVLSHNPIETLPLELCNLDHLWNLEYEGCNLISPPKQDLDKYRLAADKLLYMKSLLHE